MRISVYIPVYTKIHTQTCYFSKHETDPNKTNAKKSNAQRTQCMPTFEHTSTSTYAHVSIMSKYWKIFPRFKIPTETSVKSISTLGCRLFASATSQRRISTGETALKGTDAARTSKTLRINKKLKRPRSLLCRALFTPAEQDEEGEQTPCQHLS